KTRAPKLRANVQCRRGFGRQLKRCPVHPGRPADRLQRRGPVLQNLPPLLFGQTPDYGMKGSFAAQPRLIRFHVCHGHSFYVAAIESGLRHIAPPRREWWISEAQKTVFQGGTCQPDQRLLLLPVPSIAPTAPSAQPPDPLRR